MREWFSLQLTLRVLILILLCGGSAALVIWGKAPTAATIALCMAAFAAASVWHLVNRGNADLARFLLVLEHGDLSQTFARTGRGASFDRLGGAYERILARLRLERSEQASSARSAEALADGAPIALLSADADGMIHFANKAARTLFGRSGRCALNELDAYGGSFARAVAEAAPGTTRLTHLAVGGPPQRVSIDATLLEIPGERPCRILAVKVVQAELDGAEMATQIDLVRVLSHEILNSLTPVTSLAQTAAAAVAATHAPELEKARVAIAALARRATELERFVARYRSFSETPVLRPTTVEVSPWISELVDLFRFSQAADGAAVLLSLPDHSPTLVGDKGLLSQVLLNMLKNAREATVEVETPRIGLGVSTAEGQIRIVVSDNGPGISDEMIQDVFLPFFTTKRKGTGIGLSFARQIVLLHGGRINAISGSGGRFEISLPEAPPNLASPCRL